ncbi:MAG: hypothetical protein KDD47_15610 [Acidobacteria bacterium]|nr:hypothetical protein [Acidobacteriota bacterium]
MARINRWSTLALTLLLLTTPAMAANTGDASLFLGPQGLVIQNLAANDGATLTVAGPGEFVNRQDFPSTTGVSFEVSGDMEDGLYTYELVLQPRVGVGTRRAMDRARATNDSLAAERLGEQNKTQVISGYFTIRDGFIVAEDLQEEATRPETVTPDLDIASGAATFTNVNAAAQVFVTDVVVQGSECVGMDCVNSESFGFDTLRLKENNLRINFQDTSNSGSFPSADWRIAANDTSNGGANYLSIEDSDSGTTPFRVLKGAGNNAVYVNGSGNVGFGTATPVVELHVTDGDTPTLRLQQDGSSGFTPQIWDLAGNEANFFIRDVTNGSKLPFRIEPNTPEDTLYLDSSADIGVGTKNPSAAIHVKRSGVASDVLFRLENNNTLNFEFDNTTENDIWRFRRSGSGLVIDNADRTTGTASSNNLFFDDGRVRLGAGGNGAESFLLQTNGDLAIAGGLVTGTAGSCTSASPCDGVFHPDFEVETIEDHASYMWTHSHLPAVGPVQAGTPINLTRTTTGMLNELEKAHIFIERLNSQLKEKDAQILDLVERLEALEAKLAP